MTHHIVTHCEDLTQSSWSRMLYCQQRRLQQDALSIVLPITVRVPPSTSVLVVQDLPRTFPANAWVGSAEGQSALRNVLLAFSVHKPDVGYCQSMNYLAAMLLLCLDLSEERAFWVMVALIDDNGQCGLCLHTCCLSSVCTMSRFCCVTTLASAAVLGSSSFRALLPASCTQVLAHSLIWLIIRCLHLSSYVLIQGRSWYDATASAKGWLLCIETVLQDVSVHIGFPGNSSGTLRSSIQLHAWMPGWA